MIELACVLNERTDTRIGTVDAVVQCESSKEAGKVNVNAVAQQNPNGIKAINRFGQQNSSAPLSMIKKKRKTMDPF